MNRYEAYILSRKRVSIEEVMRHFLVSESTVRKAVNSLLSQGKVRRIVRNRKRYFTNTEGHRPSGHQGVRREKVLCVPNLEIFGRG